jgi:hypothetical protein
MDNSVSNIQLTPEAKRMIEGEIAYQTSGAGFWIGVVIVYVVSIVAAIVFLTLTISETFFGSQTNWFGLLWSPWLLIPAWFISSIHRGLKYRKGPAPEQKTS